MCLFFSRIICIMHCLVVKMDRENFTITDQNSLRALHHFCLSATNRESCSETIIKGIRKQLALPFPPTKQKIPSSAGFGQVSVQYSFLVGLPLKGKSFVQVSKQGCCASHDNEKLMGQNLSPPKSVTSP